MKRNRIEQAADVRGELQLRGRRSASKSLSGEINSDNSLIYTDRRLERQGNRLVFRRAS